MSDSEEVLRLRAQLHEMTERWRKAVSALAGMGVRVRELEAHSNCPGSLGCATCVAQAEMAAWQDACEERDKRIKELEKQRGEPVGWFVMRRLEPTWQFLSDPDEAGMWRNRGYDVRVAYSAGSGSAEQKPEPRDSNQFNDLGDTQGIIDIQREEYPGTMRSAELSRLTCAACNAGPNMIGPKHTCSPLSEARRAWGIVQEPADEPETAESWHAVGDGAFAPPFGTIRKCRVCGCLVAGGPTACVRCGLSGASLQCDQTQGASGAEGSFDDPHRHPGRPR